MVIDDKPTEPKTIEVKPLESVNFSKFTKEELVYDIEYFFKKQGKGVKVLDNKTKAKFLVIIANSKDSNTIKLKAN